MNFVHIADIHFDSIFQNLSDKEGLGEQCRLYQRRVLKKVIEFIKQNEIENLFISGDLYEHKYIRRTTIEYINNLFSEIPETSIYITPGNHDPYIKNSYYNKFNWNSNVKIFNGKIERIETEEADIYGVGFTDFHWKCNEIENLKIINKNKINILIMHADLDSASEEYNSLSTKELKEKGFNYIALGHIHKPNFESNIVYPGSTFPQGFDELGKRGMIVGKIEPKSGKLEKEFVTLNEIIFKEEEIDITLINSKEELIEKINELNFSYSNPKEFVKIVLTGKRNFEIDIYDIYKLIENDSVIKIKNNTKINYNLENLANETTLKGIYIKEMLKRMENCQDETEKQIIENAIEIGLDILES